MYEDLEGWFFKEDVGVYRRAVEAAPPAGALFVELGAWFGKSTVCMAELIRDSGKAITFYTVDTWQGTPGDQSQTDRLAASYGNAYGIFQGNLKTNGVESLVRPIRMRTDQASGTFEDGSLDFVYIDADHSFEGVIQDITSWLPKMKPGGVLAGHDYDLVRRPVESLLGAVNNDVTSWWYDVPKTPPHDRK